MKTKILLTCFTFCILHLNATTIPSVKQQLESLNKYWINSECNYPELKSNVVLNNDVDLIRMHLTLVIKYLHETTSGNLTLLQLQNRNRCLDNLSEYCIKGVFPKNLHHSVRTPYFIDDFGTACAVGQMIITSGHEDLAKKISAQNNYEYIENMNYPEINSWADEFGFTVNELKWIQPSYGCSGAPCAFDTKRNVSCYGGYDGCIGTPSTTLTHPPFSYTFSYFNYLGQWDVIFQTCDLPSGSYKCLITDSIGLTEERFYSIEQPDTIHFSKSINDDYGMCNGSIAITALGGTPSYNYVWNHTSTPSSYLTNLCHGTYYLTVYDYNNCMKTDSMVIDLISGVNESERKYFSISPIPAENELHIKSLLLNDKTIEVNVYNSSGSLVFSNNEFPSTGSIDVSDFSKGFYVLSITGKDQTLKYRFVKQ